MSLAKIDSAWLERASPHGCGIGDPQVLLCDTKSVPTSGVQATLLHVGDERTGVVTGDDAAPEPVVMLEIGSRRTAHVAVSERTRRKALYGL